VIRQSVIGFNLGVARPALRFPFAQSCESSNFCAVERKLSLYWRFWVANSEAKILLLQRLMQPQWCAAVAPAEIRGEEFEGSAQLLQKLTAISRLSVRRCRIRERMYDNGALSLCGEAGWT
jgi:hypothetical protein